MRYFLKDLPKDVERSSFKFLVYDPKLKTILWKRKHHLPSVLSSTSFESWNCFLTKDCGSDHRLHECSQVNCCKVRTKLKTGSILADRRIVIQAASHIQWTNRPLTLFVIFVQWWWFSIFILDVTTQILTIATHLIFFTMTAFIHNPHVYFYIIKFQSQNQRSILKRYSTNHLAN